MENHVTAPMTQKRLRLRARLTKIIIGCCLLFMGLGTIVDISAHAEPQSSLSVSMHNQRFSANIIRAPLEEVLTTFTSYGLIQFVIKGDVRNDLISTSFRHLSLEESLEKLLVKYDFAIIHHQVDASPNTSKFPHLTDVVILSRNRFEYPSDPREHVVTSPSSHFPLPEPVLSSDNLEKSDSLIPMDLEVTATSREFLEEIEEVLPDTDTESLALIKQLLKE